MMITRQRAGWARRTAAGAAAVVILAVAAGIVGASSAQARPPHRHAIGGGRLASPGVVVSAAAPKLPRKKVLTSSSWLVADADSGEVLAAKNPHGKFLPASTLKTLTAVTLLPRLDPRTKIRPSRSDIDVDGSKVGLVPTMRYTVDELFTCMLVVSGNDCANTLADAAGGKAKTLRLMNAEARHLGALDTVARTPSGLDGKGESSSAYDLALIARAGLGMPAFRHYVGILRDEFPAPHHKHYEIDNHNRLLTRYRGDIGVKNGYTVAAKATYVGAATRGGHTVVVTLMHARPNFWPEARALLDWGFAAEGAPAVGRLVRPGTATETVNADRAGAHASAPARTPPAPRRPARQAAHRSKAASKAGPAKAGGLTLPLLIVVVGVCAGGGATVAGRRRRRSRARHSGDTK
jgi:D-alanyl-D-alanine carboxypeptidase (penicillin-binding protein 5/6)